MADREGLPIAPGQIYIEVEYDYEYKAKDKTVIIRQGECYVLVKKTNEDWWQVRKEEGMKAFYVPAQYVREVRRALMPPQKPTLRAKPTVLDICRASNENLNRPQPEMSSFGRPSPSSTPSPSSDRVTPPVLSKDANQNLGSPHHCKVVAELVLLHNNNNHHHANNSTLPRTRADSPPLKVGNNHNKSPDSDKTSPPSDLRGDRLNKLHNDSESGDELSSSSTEHMQTTSPTGPGRSDSPVYTNLQELKISQSSLPPVPSSSPLHILGDWETHKDLSGRHFYYNRASGERTWKPPRTRDASSSTSSIRGDSQGTAESEYNMSPQSGEVPKSRSLERKQQDPIVLTKWRHSTYVLDLNDKECAPVPKQSSPDSDSCPSSPKHPSTPSEKCGVLNVTKITENGKKVRKNWTSSWTVLQGSSLLFAKGQGASTSWFGSNQSKPEFTVDLRGGSVDWASKDKSSKKHVIELKTRQGTELLIQSEIDSVINDWYRALTETISTHAWESDEAIEEDMPESPGAEKQDKEKDHRDSKKNRVMKTSVSMDSSDQKKTRLKLKKFLTRRPTYQAVRDKGYIKDQVFGCSLIPNFVTMCIDHVENTGLSIDGLYRVSGNLAVIQKLRFAVNHDEKVDLNDSKWEDIHVTTGALKMFFRELPEPLFTYGSFDDFVDAIKCSDYKQRVNSIKDLIKKLPKPNHDTMQGLFKHLRRVIDHGEANRMTTQSVAIVFGPTLLRPETETGNIAVHMVYQNQIVELILLEYESIFGR
uniref:Rho GTPase activating protein 12 n=1 Tax=Sander lucioperca TaxID=283035 RepID=A0A8C9YDG4_SANLU